MMIASQVYFKPARIDPMLGLLAGPSDLIVLTDDFRLKAKGLLIKPTRLKTL